MEDPLASSTTFDEVNDEVKKINNFFFLMTACYTSWGKDFNPGGGGGGGF